MIAEADVLHDRADAGDGQTQIAGDEQNTAQKQASRRGFHGECAKSKQMTQCNPLRDGKIWL